MFCICLHACFKAYHIVSYISCIKHILKNILHGTLDLGLWYPKESKMSLISYSDMDKLLSKNRFYEIKSFLGFTHDKNV